MTKGKVVRVFLVLVVIHISYRMGRRCVLVRAKLIRDEIPERHFKVDVIILK